MQTIDDMVAQLAKHGLGQSRGGGPADRLIDLGDFGANPGALRARAYIPRDLPAGAALVVVLHGCTQTAAGYDHGSGWSTLADRYGFALLFPEQTRANNPSCCFNWFSPDDTQRERGEAESIRQMIERLAADQRIDRSRIFVTGLSAGGAMTSVMLATYPELFAGGAIIAGLPYGVASNVPEAFERMRGQGGPGSSQLADAVRRASAHRGPWPTISIWHGSGDATVAPSNARAILDQWRALHGVGAKPSLTETVDGYPRRVWTDGSGREVIEEYSITGMGHGTPLSVHGDHGVGAAGAFMLEASISSTYRIARFWGLIGEEVAAPAREPELTLPAARTAERVHAKTAPPAATGVQEVIERALRSAGLMK